MAKGAAQAVEPLATPTALIPLTIRLSLVATIFDRRPGITERADNAVRPSPVADGLEALGVVEKILDVDHDAVARRGER